MPLRGPPGLQPAYRGPANGREGGGGYEADDLAPAGTGRKEVSRT